MRHAWPLFVDFRTFEEFLKQLKLLDFCGIQTGVICEEGKHADHLTTATAQGPVFFNSTPFTQTLEAFIGVTNAQGFIIWKRCFRGSIIFAFIFCFFIFICFFICFFICVFICFLFAFYLLYLLTLICFICFLFAFLFFAFYFCFYNFSFSNDCFFPEYCEYF